MTRPLTLEEEVHGGWPGPYPRSLTEETRRLILLAIFKPEWEEALRIDQERREAEARIHGASVDTYAVYKSSLRPPGIEPPFSNKKAGRARKDRPMRKPWIEPWA